MHGADGRVRSVNLTVVYLGLKYKYVHVYENNNTCISNNVQSRSFDR